MVRWIVTLLFALVFIPTTMMFFATRAVIRFPGDTDEVVSTLRESDLRKVTLDSTASVMRERLTQQYGAALASFMLANLRPDLEKVLTEDRFYDLVSQGHRGLVQAILGDDDVPINLRDLKRALSETLRADSPERCQSNNPPPGCSAVDASARPQPSLYDAQVEAAIAAIPDEATVSQFIFARRNDASASTADELREFREVIGQLAVLEKGVGFALLLLLGLIAVLHVVKSIPMGLIVPGVVLLITAGGYLLLASALSAGVAENITQEVVAESMTGDPDMDRELVTMTGAVIGQAFNYGRDTVWILFIASVCMVGGGVALNVLTDD